MATKAAPRLDPSLAIDFVYLRFASVLASCGTALFHFAFSAAGGTSQRNADNAAKLRVGLTSSFRREISYLVKRYDANHLNRPAVMPRGRLAEMRFR
jgi:hypothetical protein